MPLSEEGKLHELLRKLVSLVLLTLFYINILYCSAVCELGTVWEPLAPFNLSEKYWRYTSNLYRNTPLICNAVPRWLLRFGEREAPQYTSNLRCSTPPICTAIRLLLPAMLWRKYQGLGVPESS